MNQKGDRHKRKSQGVTGISNKKGAEDAKSVRRKSQVSHKGKQDQEVSKGDES